MSEWLRCKEEILDAMSDDGSVRNLAGGKRLAGVRPDVYFEMAGAKVVVELAKNSRSLSEIELRTWKYSRLDVHVLWLLPVSETTWVGCEDEDVCRIRKSQEYLHTLCFGRVYYWQNGVIWAGHFEKVYRDTPEGNWIDDYEEQSREDLSGTYWYQASYDDAHYGGGRRLLKSCRTVNWMERELHITKDFRPAYRKPFDCKRYSVPECGLWMDREIKWWGRVGEQSAARASGQ